MCPQYFGVKIVSIKKIKTLANKYPLARFRKIFKHMLNFNNFSGMLILIGVKYMPKDLYKDSFFSHGLNLKKK